MNRRSRLGGLSVCPKDTRCDIPFLCRFADERLELSCTCTHIQDIFREYLSSLQIWTDDARLIELGSSKRRFCVQFAALCRARSISTAKPYGYYVSCKSHNRQYRRSQLRSSDNSIIDHVNTPPNVVYINTRKGYGTFASSDYKMQQLVCQYMGQIIEHEEYERRRVDYDERGIPNKIIHLPNSRFGCNLYLDGAVNKDGRLIHATENAASAMNNSATSPNCKMIAAQSADGTVKMVMVTKTGVSKGTELTWWYGDKRPGLDDWVYE